MKLTLKLRQEEVPDVETFIFGYSENLEWNAGQYVHYVLHHEPTDDRGSDRYFTNSAAPFEKIVRITTRFTNDRSSSFKKILKDLEVGKTIEISNVSGKFVIEDERAQYIFIAGGIGITPFRSILKEYDHRGIKLQVTLLYANKDANIIFQAELEELAKTNHNLQIHYIMSPEHIDANKIIQLVPNMHQAFFYISGPEPMVDSITEMLKNMGVTDDHIKQDWFPGYAA